MQRANTNLALQTKNTRNTTEDFTYERQPSDCRGSGRHKESGNLISANRGNPRSEVIACLPRIGTPGLKQDFPKVFFLSVSYLNLYLINRSHKTFSTNIVLFIENKNTCRCISRYLEIHIPWFDLWFQLVACSVQYLDNK